VVPGLLLNTQRLDGTFYATACTPDRLSVCDGTKPFLGLTERTVDLGAWSAAAPADGPGLVPATTSPQCPRSHAQAQANKFGRISAPSPIELAQPNATGLGACT
jgi:hypothetical protein